MRKNNVRYAFRDIAIVTLLVIIVEFYPSRVGYMKELKVKVYYILS